MTNAQLSHILDELAFQLDDELAFLNEWPQATDEEIEAFEKWAKTFGLNFAR